MGESHGAGLAPQLFLPPVQQKRNACSPLPGQLGNADSTVCHALQPACMERSLLAQHRKRRPCGDPCRAQPRGLQRPRCAIWGCAGQMIRQKSLSTGACLGAMTECLVRDSAHTVQHELQALSAAWSARHLPSGHSSTLRGCFRSRAATSQVSCNYEPGASLLNIWVQLQRRHAGVPHAALPQCRSSAWCCPPLRACTARCESCSCLDAALPSMQVQQQSAAHCTSPQKRVAPAPDPVSMALATLEQAKGGLACQAQNGSRRCACRRSSSGDLGQPLTQQQRHQRRRERQERQARLAAKQRLERDELQRRNSLKRSGSRPTEGSGKPPGFARNGSDLFDKPSGEA